MAAPTTSDLTEVPARVTTPTTGTDRCARFGTFAECPHCGSDMAPEHAHYRCTGCGWRDSCCD